MLVATILDSTAKSHLGALSSVWLSMVTESCILLTFWWDIDQPENNFLHPHQGGIPWQSLCIELHGLIYSNLLCYYWWIFAFVVTTLNTITHKAFPFHSLHFILFFSWWWWGGEGRWFPRQDENVEIKRLFYFTLSLAHFLSLLLCFPCIGEDVEFLLLWLMGFHASSSCQRCSCADHVIGHLWVTSIPTPLKPTSRLQVEEEKRGQTGA